VKQARRRLDLVLVDRGLASSRSRAKAMVTEAKVHVNGLPASGPSQMVSPDQTVALAEPDIPYVSRGGVKLAGALDELGLSPAGRICLDAGASTGGFTDCMLQRGATKVYAVDVGYGQLAWSLRQDERVVVIERQNARHLTADVVPEKVGFVTADLAFISLTKVLPALVSVAAPACTYLLMIAAAAAALGLEERARADSTLPGPKGNREIFLWIEA